MKNKMLKQLTEIVGKKNVSADKIDLLHYAYDATQSMYLPDFVVFPENTEQISHLLELCTEYRMPVVPRGAGTGFSGGSLPISGGVCLSMEKMNRILEIDTENLTACVEAGVINYDLQQEAERLGLFYPPDPSSYKYCTVGGNVAENAGGPRAVKYGVTKNYVLGMELVFPTGEIVISGSKNMKDVAGYNLKDLMIGSEGTLAVITKLFLKLIPLPPYRSVLQAIFSDMKEAAQTVSSIIANRIIPSALEFIDGPCIRAVEDYLHIGLPEEAQAMLIIECDGRKESVEAELSLIEEVCKKNNAQYVKMAKDKEEEEFLWRARRSISPSLNRIRDGKLNEDVVVPRASLPEMIEFTQKISKKYNLPIVNFGHAGDGNIHTNIMFKKKSEEEKRARDAMREIFETVIRMGGSISGEHGIGITKQDFLEKQLGKESIEIFRKIKRALDPNNILNPHKMKL